MCCLYSISTRYNAAYIAGSVSSSIKSARSLLLCSCSLSSLLCHSLSLSSFSLLSLSYSPSNYHTFLFVSHLYFVYLAIRLLYHSRYACLAIVLHYKCVEHIKLSCVHCTEFIALLYTNTNSLVCACLLFASRRSTTKANFLAEIMASEILLWLKTLG